MTPTPPDITPEPHNIGADAEVGRAESRPDATTNAGVADAGAGLPEVGVAGAATRAGAPRPVLGAVGRQLADNAIVILLTGIVVAVMSFGFEGLGTRIDDTNARIDELSKSLGTRIDDTNARIDDTAKSINTRIDELSKSLNTRIDDTNARIDELSRAVADNGQRLARIEGFLGIGMPEEAAARAPGAALGGEPDPAPEESAQSGGQPGG